MIATIILLFAAFLVLFVCGLVWFRITEESPCDAHDTHHERREG